MIQGFIQNKGFRSQGTCVGGTSTTRVSRGSGGGYTMTRESRIEIDTQTTKDLEERRGKGLQLESQSSEERESLKDGFPYGVGFVVGVTGPQSHRRGLVLRRRTLGRRQFQKCDVVVM